MPSTDETGRPAFAVRAHMILRTGDRLLLTSRAPHLPGGGCWQLPGGHLEPGETVLECAIREVREEVGVTVAAEDAALVHTSHVFTVAGATRLALVFAAERWHGEPVNLEPALCTAIGFFAINALPRPLVPYLAQAIARYLRREPFSVYHPVSAAGSVVGPARA